MKNTNLNIESINATFTADYSLQGKKDVLTDFATVCVVNEIKTARLFNSIQLNTIAGLTALLYKHIAKGESKKEQDESLKTFITTLYTKEGATLPNDRNLRRKIQVARYVFKKISVNADAMNQPNRFITELVNKLSAYKDYTSLYAEMEEANRKTPRETSEAEKINRAIDALFAKIDESQDSAGYLRIIADKVAERQAQAAA